MDKLYTFHVEVKSRQADKTYTGTFTLRRPDLADLGAISASMSRMNQGETFVSNSYEILFTAINTVTVCGAGDNGETVPDWWEEVVAAPTDTQVIMAIWARLVEAREKKLPFRSDEDQAEASSDATEGADSA